MPRTKEFDTPAGTLAGSGPEPRTAIAEAAARYRKASAEEERAYDRECAEATIHARADEARKESQDALLELVHDANEQATVIVGGTLYFSESYKEDGKFLRRLREIDLAKIQVIRAEGEGEGDAQGEEVERPPGEVPGQAGQSRGQDMG